MSAKGDIKPFRSLEGHHIMYVYIIINIYIIGDWN